MSVHYTRASTRTLATWLVEAINTRLAFGGEAREGTDEASRLVLSELCDRGEHWLAALPAQGGTCQQCGRDAGPRPGSRTWRGRMIAEEERRYAADFGEVQS